MATKDPHPHRGQELIHDLSRHASVARPKSSAPQRPSLAQPRTPVGLTRGPRLGGTQGAGPGHAQRGAPKGRSFTPGR